MKAQAWFKFKQFLDSNIPMNGTAPIQKLSDSNIDIMIKLLQDIKNVPHYSFNGKLVDDYDGHVQLTNALNTIK